MTKFITLLFLILISGCCSSVTCGTNEPNERTIRFEILDKNTGQNILPTLTNETIEFHLILFGIDTTLVQEFKDFNNNSTYLNLEIPQNTIGCSLPVSRPIIVKIGTQEIVEGNINFDNEILDKCCEDLCTAKFISGINIQTTMDNYNYGDESIKVVKIKI